MANTIAVTTRIRRFLRDKEIDTLAALQLGGRGEWFTSHDVVDMLIEAKILGTHNISSRTVSCLLRETKFLRWDIMELVRRMI